MPFPTISTGSTALSLLLLLSPLTSAAAELPCAKEAAFGLDDRCYSNQKMELNSCLALIVEESNIVPSSVQDCFVKAGCNELEAKAEAEWVFKSCHTDELKRRQSNNDDDKDEEEEETTTTRRAARTTTTAEEEEETTSATRRVVTITRQAAATTAASDDDEDEEEEETTTSSRRRPASTTSTPEPEPETASTTPDPAPASTLTQTVQPSDDTTAQQTTASGAVNAALASTSLVCYTTVTYTTAAWDVISTNTAGRVTRTFNSAKVASKTQCADGLLCRPEGCMVANNELGGSGIAVTIFFGVSALVVACTIVFLCLRDRKKMKAIEARMESEKAAKEARQAAFAAANTKSAAGPGAAVRPGGRRYPSAGRKASGQPLLTQGLYPSPHSPATPTSPRSPMQDQFSVR